MGKFPSSGRLRLTLKQAEWFVLWWREVFLSTYFFPPNISRSAPGGGGAMTSACQLLLAIFTKLAALMT
jgi:hypothetical protein